MDGADGFASPTANSAVTFIELRMSSVSLTNDPGALSSEPWLHHICRCVHRAGSLRICRRKSPSVMMPTNLFCASVIPTQPKPLADICRMASDIAAPSWRQRHQVAGMHEVADGSEQRPQLAARM